MPFVITVCGFVDPFRYSVTLGAKRFVTQRFPSLSMAQYAGPSVPFLIILDGLVLPAGYSETHPGPVGGSLVTYKRLIAVQAVGGCGVESVRDGSFRAGVLRLGIVYQTSPAYSTT